jgi:hypothetical protein
MEFHRHRDNSSRFFSGTLYEELAQRLIALYTTIDDTLETPEHNLAAMESVEALFMRDAQVIEQKLAWARAQFNTSFQERRPSLCFLSIYPGDYFDGLVRDTRGNVRAVARDSLSLGVAVREIYLLGSCALVLLWTAVELFASCFGPYKAHVAWTLVGLFLGINKRALGDMLFLILVILLDPFTCLKAFYGNEIEFRRQLRQEATPERGLSSTRMDWISKASFHKRLCIFAVSEYVVFDCFDVRMDFGLCCVYFAWFTTLSMFV